MWFLFGIVSTLSFAAYAGYRRFVEPWSGSAHEVNGRPFEAKLVKHKGSVVKVLIAVRCPHDYDFAVRRENALDRLFARLGMPGDRKVGDTVFDDSTYVTSDDTRLHRALRAAPALRDAFFDLVHDVDSRMLMVRRVRCVGGRIWVEARPGTDLSTVTVEPSAALVVPALCVVAAQLEAQGASGRATEFDRSILPAVVLLGIASGLAINGFVHVVRIAALRSPRVLDAGEIMSASAIVGLAGSAALLSLCVALLRGSSRAHLVALELLLTGTFGCITTSYVELHDFNVEADAAPARVLRVGVLDRQRYRCGKRGRSTCYRLMLAPFDGLPAQEVQLSLTQYRWFENATTADVTVGAGRLGFRWLRDVRPAR